MEEMMKLTFEITDEKIKEKICQLRDKCQNLTHLFNTWVLESELVENIVIKE